MRWLFVTLSLVLIMTIAIDHAHGQRGEGCRLACSREYNPVCGFNGKCYRLFANPCVFSAEKCSKQQNLSKVSRSFCEDAKDGLNTAVSYCR